MRILQFLECPQYLRKQLFPLHKDLQYAGGGIWKLIYYKISTYGIS